MGVGLSCRRHQSQLQQPAALSRFSPFSVYLPEICLTEPSMSDLGQALLVPGLDRLTRTRERILTLDCCPSSAYNDPEYVSGEFDIFRLSILAVSAHIKCHQRLHQSRTACLYQIHRWSISEPSFQMMYGRREAPA
ncbi:hypothetical protein ASPCAL01077 [Aspergillus calidoustus]|uniref:Uncharacterized protein n=1 Tax=Aspergillus calidoustus TaxID=454130 RepID=A0A0U5FSA7_ASPCI|nr:hypothetical protein ASPCAL01077 [Aspergillus calidoustus]